METTDIEIVSREWVKPSTPTPPHKREHKLSILDQLVPGKFAALVFFYDDKNHPSQPPKQTLHLKQSLSHCLSQFYPLAGKLKPVAGVLTVDCDDSGALFLEAKVGAPMAQVLHNNGSWQNFGHYLPFEPFVNYNDELIIAPSHSSYPKNKMPLAIQVTRFDCGGAAIGVCASHKVVDMASLLTFVNLWAAASRGEEGQVMKQPVINFDIGTQIFPAPPNLAGLLATFDSAFAAAEEQGGKNKMVTKRFVFSKEKIAQLKEQATSSASSSIVSPTRVEAVTAFLWKQIINVQGARKGLTNRVLHAVNLRTRMRRLVDQDDFAFGNLSFVAPATFTCNGDVISYGDLAGVTSDAIRKINHEDYVVNFCDNLTPKRLEEMLKSELSGWPCSSFCRFPMYGVDFGWGQPISVGPAGLRPYTGVVLTTTRGGHQIIAWTSLPEEEMALLPDQLLSLQATQFY